MEHNNTDIIYTRDISLEEQAVKDIASLYHFGDNRRWSIREKMTRILVILSAACKKKYYEDEESCEKEKSKEHLSLLHFNDYIKGVIEHFRSKEQLRIPISGSVRSWDSCFNNLKLIADYAPEEIKKDVVDRMNLFLDLLNVEKKQEKKFKWKFLLYFYLVLFVAGGGTYLFLTLKDNKKSDSGYEKVASSSSRKATTSSNRWVGKWGKNGKVWFTLYNNNTAHVTYGFLDYNTQWEDAGEQVVIGVQKGSAIQAILIGKDGKMYYLDRDNVIKWETTLEKMK